MNLYKEQFDHYAPKDSIRGIAKYFLAQDDKEAYSIVYTSTPCWVDNAEENEDENPDAVQIAINEVIEAKGEMNMEDVEFNDLYYGLTYKGWEIVKEDITDDEIQTLKNVGIL